MVERYVLRLLYPLRNTFHSVWENEVEQRKCQGIYATRRYVTLL